MERCGRFSPLCFRFSWPESKRIRGVVRSNLAGETDGIDNAVFRATLFSVLTSGNAELKAPSLICVTDNHSLFDALKKQRKDWKGKVGNKQHKGAPPK